MDGGKRGSSTPPTRTSTDASSEEIVTGSESEVVSRHSPSTHAADSVRCSCTDPIRYPTSTAPAAPSTITSRTAASAIGSAERSTASGAA
jgi:hypothetical protein